MKVEQQDSLIYLFTYRPHVWQWRWSSRTHLFTCLLTGRRFGSEGRAAGLTYLLVYLQAAGLAVKVEQQDSLIYLFTYRPQVWQWRLSSRTYLFTCLLTGRTFGSEGGAAGLTYLLVYLQAAGLTVKVEQQDSLIYLFTYRPQVWQWRWSSRTHLFTCLLTGRRFGSEGGAAGLTYLLVYLQAARLAVKVEQQDSLIYFFTYRPQVWQWRWSSRTYLFTGLLTGCRFGSEGRAAGLTYLLVYLQAAGLAVKVEQQDSLIYWFTYRPHVWQWRWSSRTHLFTGLLTGRRFGSEGGAAGLT